ncbi:MAG: hypothetical protein HYW27_02305 [Candidatus Aenigmarchaeota archaeon]|nr:hypothetical protein [Candidatus Aenigmarchaeota archaeon]
MHQKIGFMDAYKTVRDIALLADYRAIDEEKRRLHERAHLLWDYLTEGHDPETAYDNIQMVLSHPIIYAGTMAGFLRHPIRSFKAFAYPVMDSKYDD